MYGIKSAEQLLHNTTPPNREYMVKSERDGTEQEGQQRENKKSMGNLRNSSIASRKRCTNGHSKATMRETTRSEHGTAQFTCVAAAVWGRGGGGGGLKAQNEAGRRRAGHGSCQETHSILSASVLVRDQAAACAVTGRPHPKSNVVETGVLQTDTRPVGNPSLWQRAGGGGVSDNWRNRAWSGAERL